MCQSTLELVNIGKGPVVKHIKSVKHVQNSESRKSSSAAMLASWTGANFAPSPPPLPQKEPMIRFFLAYVSNDFKTKKNLTEKFLTFFFKFVFL